MKIRSLLSTLLSALCFCTAYASPIQPNECKTIDVGQRPESIIVGFGGDKFVSVMGGTEPGDATIARIHNGEVSTFAVGLNEPKGLAFVNSTLFVSDVDRVMAIDSEGNVKTLAGPEDFPFPVSYLNDVAADLFQTGIYVADMGDNSNLWASSDPREFWAIDSPEANAFQVIGRIYHISLEGKVSCVVDASPTMLCPNGVSLDNNGNILIGAFFNGYLLSVSNNEFQVLAEGLRGADAVEQDRDGNYYVSSWNQGKIWKITEEGEVSTFAEGFQSAADFYLDEKNRLLFLPDMLAGKVYQLLLD